MNSTFTRRLGLILPNVVNVTVLPRVATARSAGIIAKFVRQNHQ